jgi:hypothetical protein
MGKYHRENEASEIIHKGQTNYHKQIIGNLKPEITKFLGKKTKAI